MTFFKRKDKNLIPPVQGPDLSYDTRKSDNYRTTYNPSRDGDLYGTNTNGYKPSLSRDASGQGNDDSNRRELFSGYNPENTGSNRFKNSAGNELAGEGDDEDVEGIKQQIRTTKQDTVNSTRNALRLAREAEETARNTLTKLGDQSEKFANTERHLDVTKNHSLRAEDNTDELKKLNRSIFVPVISFNKDAKRAAQAAKIQNRYDDEKEERKRAMSDIRDTQDRLGKAVTYGRDNEEGIGGRRPSKTESQVAARKEQRKRFQFETTASDDEMEDELDDNLDELSDMTKRLKALGTSMGQELDSQNHRIDRISDKASAADQQMFRNTERLKRIK